MKSAKPKEPRLPSDALIREFWRWFANIERRVDSEIETPRLVGEIDTWISRLHPNVSWEIGPGREKPWQFVISPNLDGHLLPLTRSIVSMAPSLGRWEFYSCRQPKDWNLKFELDAASHGSISIDASTWGYVLLKYPNGSHEIVIRGTDIRDLDADTRRQAAAILLEGILGEERLIEKIDDFELVDNLDPQHSLLEKPIGDLANIFHGEVKRGDANNETGSAIVCSHVAAGYPILLAERSATDDPVDTGWQFVCDSGLDEDLETAQVWRLNEVLVIEPSLKPFLNEPPGTELRRENRTSPWQVSDRSNPAGG